MTDTHRIAAEAIYESVMDALSLPDDRTPQWSDWLTSAAAILAEHYEPKPGEPGQSSGSMPRDVKTVSGERGPDDPAEAVAKAWLGPHATQAAYDNLAAMIREGVVEELERERMRLAVCSTAALGYFVGCADEYKSASLDDVLALRADNERLEQFVADTCEDMECLPGCNSDAHEEGCPVVDPAQAFRQLRAEEEKQAKDAGCLAAEVERKDQQLAAMRTRLTAIMTDEEIDAALAATEGRE